MTSSEVSIQIFLFCSLEKDKTPPTPVKKFDTAGNEQCLILLEPEKLFIEHPSQCNKYLIQPKVILKLIQKLKLINLEVVYIVCTSLWRVLHLYSCVCSSGICKEWTTLIKKSLQDGSPAES